MKHRNFQAAAAEDILLFESEPVESPKVVNYIFAVVDGARARAVYFGRSMNVGAPPLTLLDCDCKQAEGSSPIDWLSGIGLRLQQFASECRAIRGSIGMFILDKGPGMVLLQQAVAHNFQARAIDSKLAALSEKELALITSAHIAAGDVRATHEAREKWKSGSISPIECVLYGIVLALRRE